MTRKERIKDLQRLIGANPDGVIGNETLRKFAERFNRTIVQTVHFFAQIHHESGGFTVGRENMNYTAPRIMQIFGIGKHSAKVTVAEAGRLAGNPWDLAERVYGLGNPKKAKELGNIKVGDGFKYRGGGALQCTGASDYNKYGGQRLYEKPELIETSEFYFSTALKEFDARGIWSLAKDYSSSSILSVTKRVNGGTNGLQDRINKTAYYAKMFK